MGNNLADPLARVPSTGAPRKPVEVSLPAPLHASEVLAEAGSGSPIDPRPDPREVLRCLHCQLVQFRTHNNLCRRCGVDLDAVPARAAVRACAPPLPAPALGAEEAGVETAEATGIPVPDVAGAIRSWRQRRGLSQRELAERMRVPRTYVSKIENDKATPTIGSLQRMATAMDTNIAALLGSPAAAAPQGLLDDAFVRALMPLLSKLAPNHRGQLLDASRHLAGA